MRHNVIWHYLRRLRVRLPRHFRHADMLDIITDTLFDAGTRAAVDAAPRR